MARDGTCHDPREARAHMVLGPTAFALSRFISDVGEGDVPTEMPSILIESPEPEMTQKRKPVINRPRNTIAPT